MTWHTIIDFPVGDWKDVEAVCSDIFRKDDTFLWKIETLDKELCRLIVKSDSKDKAHKRKVWLLNKVEALKDFRSFGVKWVKE